jgi:hypothetical protein
MAIPNKRASYGELLLLNSLLSVGFVCRSIKNFDKAALNGTLETLSNRLIMAANRKTGCTLAGGQKTVRRSPGRAKGL